MRIHYDTVAIARRGNGHIFIENVLEDLLRASLQGVAPAASTRALENEGVAGREPMCAEKRALPTPIGSEAADHLRISVALVNQSLDGARLAPTDPRAALACTGSLHAQLAVSEEAHLEDRTEAAPVKPRSRRVATELESLIHDRKQ